MSSCSCTSIHDHVLPTSKEEGIDFKYVSSQRVHHSLSNSAEDEKEDEEGEEAILAVCHSHSILCILHGRREGGREEAEVFCAFVVGSGANPRWTAAAVQRKNIVPFGVGIHK